MPMYTLGVYWELEGDRVNGAGVNVVLGRGGSLARVGSATEILANPGPHTRHANPGPHHSAVWSVTAS